MSFQAKRRLASSCCIWCKLSGDSLRATSTCRHGPPLGSGKAAEVCKRSMSPVRSFQILYSLPFVLTFFFHSNTSFITSLISVQFNNIINPDAPDGLHLLLISTLCSYTALQLDMHNLFRIAEYLQVYGSAYLSPALFQRQSLNPERMQETFICKPDAGYYSISSSTQTTLQCLDTAPNSS
jgi:hypothetical protein